MGVTTLVKSQVRSNQYNNGYSSLEDDFVIANHGKMNYEEIGKILGRPSSSVRGRARKYLKLDSLRPDVTDWLALEINIIKTNFETNPNIYAMLPNRSYQSINGKAFKLGLKKNGRGNCNIDANYFRTTLTPSKAYIIGLIAADGNLLKKIYWHKNHNLSQEFYRLTLTQNKKDIELLELIKKEMQCNAKIRNRKTGCVDLTITNKRIVMDLIENYGIIPNKTYEMSNVKGISDDLFIHFLHGFIDGDGDVSGGNVAIGITGTYYILDFLADEIKRLYGIEAKISHKKEMCFRLYINREDARKLSKLICASCVDRELYLKRKMERFHNICDGIKYDTPYSNSNKNIELKEVDGRMCEFLKGFEKG